MTTANKQLWLVKVDAWYEQGAKKKEPVRTKHEFVVLAADWDEAEQIGVQQAAIVRFGPRLVGLEFRSCSTQGQFYRIGAP